MLQGWGINYTGLMTTIISNAIYLHWIFVPLGVVLRVRVLHKWSVLCIPPMPQGTFRNALGTFCLSQLREEDCYWHLVGEVGDNAQHFKMYRTASHKKE